MRKLFSALCTLLIVACAYQSAAQIQIRTMTHNSLIRNYRIHLPAAIDTCEHVPVVFNLHGSGSNGAQEGFYTLFHNMADTGRFITVYPDAVANQWELNGSTIDDVGFIQAIIDTLYAEFRIDRNRVYSCGMSMGGYMSYRLACEITDQIAAIASVTGLLATVTCNPSRPIPVMQIHGTDDATVPYSGVSNTINKWVQENNCTGSPVITQLPDSITTDNSTVTKSHYTTCDAGTEIILYTVNGGGHTWPDASINIGVTSRDMNASQVIWNFFQKYELTTYPAVTRCVWSGVENNIRNNPAFTVRYSSSAQQITVENPTVETFSLTLFDALGRSLRTFSSAGDQRITFPVALPATGVYFYVITNAQGKAEKGKITVY